MNRNKKNSFINLKSPMFWRIAAGVFASIMLIESVLLIYSWSTERDRLLTRLDGSVAILNMALDHENPLPQLDYLASTQNRNGNFNVTGFSYKSASGDVIRRGNVESIDLQATDKTPRFHSATGTYVSYLSRNKSDGSIAIRLDASWINDYMRDYVKRIVGMVILISLFVTGACLLILTPLLINPLQRLNNLLIRGEKQGIRSAKSNQKDLCRTDELGGVYRSFENLRKNLIDTENEKNSVTERFEVFANLGADCFWEVDNRLRFTYFSGDAERVLSLKAEQILGRSFREVLSTLGNSIPTGDSIFQSLAESGQWEGTIYPKYCDANEPVSVRIVASLQMDSKQNSVAIRGTIADITKETELAEELRYQATHDVLTGLHNRRELDNQLDISVDKYNTDGEIFSLMILDLDGFKHVNDGAGHAAGDALLRVLAKTIESKIGENDFVARMGGDEFAVIVRSGDIWTVKAIAEDIRLSIENNVFNWNQVNYTVGVCVGIAQMSKTLDSPQAIVFAADSCCMRAKKAGKNQVIVYSTEDDTYNLFKDEAMWISRITTALKEDDFVLFRQSIVSINNLDGENHFEILLRMKNPEGGIWTPKYFLPIAERNSLMPKIDKWVITHAIEWLRTQTISDDCNYCMSVNLSAESLADRRFREFLVDCLRQSQNLNRYVCLEMTETAAMINFDETLELLMQLKQLGCLIALDDFGTGFSSLSHIRELPLDYIKIDGVFIQEIYNNELDQALVKSVAEIAKVLRIKTVAEFVDTDAALQLLGKLNIDYAQGFLFSRPEELQFADDSGNLPRAA